MTYNIRKLKKEDLIALRAQDMNKEVLTWMTNDMMDFLVLKPFSVSIFYKDVLMLCGGVTAIWYNRALIWTVFSESSKKNFLPVFRGIKAFLQYQPFKRVELSVPCDHHVGNRRARALGFTLECDRARNFLPDGKDATLYSYIKD